MPSLQTISVGRSLPRAGGGCWATTPPLFGCGVERCTSPLHRQLKPLWSCSFPASLRFPAGSGGCRLACIMLHMKRSLPGEARRKSNGSISLSSRGVCSWYNGRRMVCTSAIPMQPAYSRAIRFRMLFRSRPRHTPGAYCVDQAAFRWRLMIRSCGRQRRSKRTSTNCSASARAAAMRSTLAGSRWTGCGIGGGCRGSCASEAKRCSRGSTTRWADDWDWIICLSSDLRHT